MKTLRARIIVHGIWVIGILALASPFASVYSFPTQEGLYSAIVLCGYAFLFLWATVVAIVLMKGDEVMWIVEGLLGCVLTLVSTPVAGRIIPGSLFLPKDVLVWFFHATSMAVLSLPVLGLVKSRLKSSGEMRR